MTKTDEQNVCHECGDILVKCLDGEEWCPRCQRYRRYPSHGWSVHYMESTEERGEREVSDV
jgi:uncharacterized Zn finger protein (UPF0148 family)